MTESIKAQSGPSNEIALTESIKAQENMHYEEIIIKYKPIDGVETISTKKVMASTEMILGVALMASQIITLDRFLVQRANQDIIDINACLNLPSVVVSGQNVTHLYDGYLNQLHVQFMTPDFIQGAIMTCMLLGYGWAGIITKLQYMSQPWNLPSDFYIGEINIERINQYDMIPIDFLKQILSKPTIESIIQSIDECFHQGNNVYIYVPALLTMSSQDAKFEVVTSSSTASSYIKHLPSKYHHLNSWYIFNVCAAKAHRGKGYTKSVMISQINSLIRSGITSFMLEVDPTNAPAWKLYQSLGFYKIDSDEESIYDLYYLPTSGAEILPPI